MINASPVVKTAVNPAQDLRIYDRISVYPNGVIKGFINYFVIGEITWIYRRIGRIRLRFRTGATGFFSLDLLKGFFFRIYH